MKPTQATPAKQRGTLVVVCAGDVGLPNGTGATVRAMSFARMHKLVVQDAELHVVGPSESPSGQPLNTRIQGHLHGCQYVYTCGITRRSKYRIVNALAQLRGIGGSSRRVLKLSMSGDLRAVLVYAPILRVALPLALLAKAGGFPILLNVCEIPLDAQFRPVGGPGRLRLRVLYSFFDGVIVVSDRLRDHVRELSRPGLSLMKMPVLMDADEFAPVDLAPTSRRVVYAGFLNERKDGVGTLLAAFAALPPSDSDVELLLVGPETNPGDEVKFRRMAADLGVGDRVVFTGRLARPQMAAVLRQATVLALARPASLQADAGFPTKLSEYLVTGKPVVVTATGEIPRFLDDGRDAFLVPPGDWRAFAEALHAALRDAANARAIGARGREVALRAFDLKANSGRLDAFLAVLETTG